MDRNTIIGLFLIFGLLYWYAQLSAPSAEQLAKEKHQRDSIALAQKNNSAKPNTTAQTQTATTTQPTAVALDTNAMKSIYGSFANAAVGSEQTSVLENEVFKITFTNKGGRIKEVLLKDYKKMTIDSLHKEYVEPLRLLEDEKNRFEYLLPVNGAAKDVVSTQDLYFTATTKGSNAISFKANTLDGGFFEQNYIIEPKTYNINYTINYNGLGNTIKNGSKNITLNWVNYLDRLEINHKYERNYSSVYYKKSKDNPTYCSCTSDDKEVINDDGIKWLSNSNQFFNSSLIAENTFQGATLSTTMFDEANADLKLLTSEVKIPYETNGNGSLNMKMYVGPNKFDNLKAYNIELEEVISYGSSILGTINRWIIRPIFNFFLSFISSKGLVILLLTLLVKLVLFPLSYKMLYSQSKMAALKPQIEALKVKYKDEPQQVQVETMKMYGEFGVNPLGGCLPMLAQMPIWLALYRFFPASIEFRQASFLWAHDLSSYEVFAWLPFDIPSYGAHFSMFAFLWTISQLAFSFYTTKDMDFSANPAMKWMQYFMPAMMLFFFNSVAAGLSFYMLASNILNIGQTILTKNVLINQDKIKEELHAYKAKPKQKSSFRQKFEDTLKESQRMQEERNKQNKKK